MELSAAEAEQYYNFLHGSRELTDEELSQVAGGKGNPLPKYKIGQKVRIGRAYYNSIFGTITRFEYYVDRGYYYYLTTDKVDNLGIFLESDSTVKIID